MGVTDVFGWAKAAATAFRTAPGGGASAPDAATARPSSEGSMSPRDLMGRFQEDLRRSRDLTPAERRDRETLDELRAALYPDPADS